MSLITKEFYEDQTGTFHGTLKAAKQATEYPDIYRVWIRDEEVIASRQICESGGMILTVKEADRYIDNYLFNDWL